MIAFRKMQIQALFASVYQRLVEHGWPDECLYCGRIVARPHKSSCETRSRRSRLNDLLLLFIRAKKCF
jgi:hypothetical protein